MNLLFPSILLYKGVLGTHTTTPASPVSGAVGHTHNPRILENDTRKCLSQEHKDYLNENLVSVVSSVTCVRLSVVYLKVVFIVMRILAYFSST